MYIYIYMYIGTPTCLKQSYATVIAVVGPSKGNDKMSTFDELQGDSNSSKADKRSIERFENDLPLPSLWCVHTKTV